MSIARNAPCPCGSGKRYKECHGAIGLPAGMATRPTSPALSALLQEALSAQQAGALDDARVRYEAALREQPDHFDALHMLGVLSLQVNDLERAETLVKCALTVRDDPSARYNLNVVLQARRIAERERALCASVLPRLAPLVAPLRDAASSLQRTTGDVHIVIAERDVPPALIERLRSLVPATLRQRLWLAAGLGADAFDSAQVEPGRFDARAMDSDDVAIVVGTAIPTGDWVNAAGASTRILIVTRDAPCEVLDRVRELSGEGRVRVLPCYVDASLREASALAAPSLDDVAALAN
jgi:hypothetical protein